MPKIVSVFGRIIKMYLIRCNLFLQGFEYLDQNRWKMASVEADEQSSR